MRALCWKSLILAFVITLVTLGCNKAGDEYLGKWQNTRNKNDQFEIVRNGDNFLITKTSSGLFGKPSKSTVPFVLKDGILQSTGTFGTAALTYVKSTGRLTTPALLGGDIEYERVKQ